MTDVNQPVPHAHLFDESGNVRNFRDELLVIRRIFGCEGCISQYAPDREIVERLAECEDFHHFCQQEFTFEKIRERGFIEEATTKLGPAEGEAERKGGSLYLDHLIYLAKKQGVTLK